MHREQPGHAFDHHLAHVVFGLADQGDAALGLIVLPRRPGEGLDPFGAGARLARAASADQQPYGPWLAVIADSRRQLMIVTVDAKAAQ